MILTLAVFMQLASACAPQVAPETLAAIAGAESGFDSLAINVNGGPDGGELHAASRAEATRLASALIRGQHRSVDLGLMQINIANLPELGLSVADAFDPCLSLSAAARILARNYDSAGGTSGAPPQRALREALSMYNSGSATAGFANGYVGRVQASARKVAASLARGGGAAMARNAPALPAATAPAAAWDVYAVAAAAPQMVFAAGGQGRAR